MDQLRRLSLNRLHDFRMAVTGRADCDAGVAVEKDVTINVRDPNAFAACGDQFEVRTRVRRVHILRVSFHDGSPFGAGKLSFDFRSSCCDCCGHHLLLLVLKPLPRHVCRADFSEAILLMVN